ncbi:MAG: YciI family protein, partial [Actinomycetota bacterium]
AVAWATRCPDPMGTGEAAEIEVRQLFEASDFPDEILPPEGKAREEELRAELEERYGAGS